MAPLQYSASLKSGCLRFRTLHGLPDLLDFRFNGGQRVVDGLQRESDVLSLQPLRALESATRLGDSGYFSNCE